MASRIREVAAQIDADYAGREILMVGVLNGAVMTMADLCRAMTSHMSMDWMAVSSYGAGTKSSGVVRILKDLDTDISGRHVVIVDEIIDAFRARFEVKMDVVITAQETENFPVMSVLRDMELTTADMAFVNGGA